MFQDVMVPDTQDRIALGAHEIITPAVIGTVGVLVAVDFHHEPFFAASEVCEERADGKLARKAMAANLALWATAPQPREQQVSCVAA